MTNDEQQQFQAQQAYQAQLAARISNTLAFSMIGFLGAQMAALNKDFAGQLQEFLRKLTVEVEQALAKEQAHVTNELMTMVINQMLGIINANAAANGVTLDVAPQKVSVVGHDADFSVQRGNGPTN